INVLRGFESHPLRRIAQGPALRGLLLSGGEGGYLEKPPVRPAAPAAQDARSAPRRGESVAKATGESIPPSLPHTPIMVPSHPVCAHHPAISPEDWMTR